MSYRSIYAHILKMHLTFLSKDYSNISSQKSGNRMYISKHAYKEVLYFICNYMWNLMI